MPHRIVWSAAARFARSGATVVALVAVCSLSMAEPTWAQSPQTAAAKPTPQTKGKSVPPKAAAKEAPPPKPTRADFLRGEYGPYRANNDLLYYHLDVRV